MISKTPLKEGEETGEMFDIIIITAEYYDDHPLSPAGIIARVLEAKGYVVGIIEKPVSKEDFTKLGRPNLFFAVTSGSIDSMLYNYTPLKKKRGLDQHSKTTSMPDRAVIFYCNKLREYFKNEKNNIGPVKIVIGGIEASLRRFAHYDYWDNKVRGSILLDSRADILVYGNGEKQIIEIAERAEAGLQLDEIKGTCLLSKALPKGFEALPRYTAVKGGDEESKRKFCKMQAMFSNNKNLGQEYNNNYVLQYRYPEYTPADLDWLYSLPFTRKLHPKSLLKMAKFSVVTHRGCIGNCNFCSISLHQGDKIISRTEQSILQELKNITKLPEFKGHIDDLGGPSANMYGMDSCKTCESNSRTNCRNSCLKCGQLDMSHSKLISLLRKARQIKGIKKIFIRSGVRYDLAMASTEYIKEISAHHISGCLKIAPEHFSKNVLQLMNKDNSKFQDFLEYFNKLNIPKKQYLKYYLMLGHPGDDTEQVRLLADKMRQLKNAEQFQLFTPTPMTNSTCMYWTGINPFTGEKIKVVHDYNTKKKMKRMVLAAIR